MRLVRSYLRNNPRLAVLLLLATLCMKALMPAGFMVEARPSAIGVVICGSAEGTQLGRVAEAAIRDKLPATGRARTDQTCPYATLAMASLGGADAPLLALALVFAMALAFLPTAAVVPAQAGWLRPPLRGPPAAA